MPLKNNTRLLGKKKTLTLMFFDQLKTLTLVFFEPEHLICYQQLQSVTLRPCVTEIRDFSHEGIDFHFVVGGK
jgi:hypothetical protein